MYSSLKPLRDSDATARLTGAKNTPVASAAPITNVPIRRLNDCIAGLLSEPLIVQMSCHYQIGLRPPFRRDSAADPADHSSVSTIWKGNYGACKRGRLDALARLQPRERAVR